jgi:hypothetical protein
MMDSSCFNLMQATLRFDTSYNVVDRNIQGGTFITEEEYQAQQSASEVERSESEST